MSSSVPNAAFYADQAGMASLKQSARTESPEALREAARQFESLFTKMMLKSMREASFGDSMAGSETTDFYRDMHDTQLAVELSKGRGLGLADMLVQQLTKAGRGTGLEAGGWGLEPESEQQSLDGPARVWSHGLDRSGPSLQPPASGPVSGSSLQPPASSQKTAANASWPPATRADFIAQLRPHAEEAGRVLGVEPDTLIAHAALETGWGRSIPNAADGDCSFNLFGIKAGSRWNGPTVGLSTLEFDQGLATRRIERFRAYASPADCFKDYAALLGNSDRYAAALGSGGDAAAFAQALHRGGYATDPDYARKLTAVADSLKSLLKSSDSVPTTGGGGEK